MLREITILKWKAKPLLEVVYWLGAIEQIGRPDDLFPSNKGAPITRLAAFAAMVFFAFSARVGGAHAT